MGLRIASDIHNEFEKWDIQITPEDKNNILVLAGDIHPRAGSAEWLSEIAPSFKEIVLVLGNHDYWKDSLETASKRLKERLTNLKVNNVHVLDRESYETEMDNKPVRFLGCTLWTDFNNSDSLTMWDASQTMKDYKKVRTHGGTKHLSTFDILKSHEKDKAFLEEHLNIPFDGYTIVVTHHAPSSQSVDPMFKDPKHYHANGSYVSNLDNWILDKTFDYWFHGHTHFSFNYPFGSGFVICNPRGYAPTDLNPDFEENFMLQLTNREPSKRVEVSDYSSWWDSLSLG